MKIAIIGAGFTGLTTALRLSQKGCRVTIFEKENYLGGLATGFKKRNWQWSLENFFHHLFTSDKAAQNSIAELDLKEKLFYLQPKTSIYHQGKITRLDSPASVLLFPYLSLLENLRVGLVTFGLKITNDWQRLEKITAAVWLRKNYGIKAYRILWQPLLKGKFGALSEQISMAWFWARIKKRSQRLGYFEGGFQVLIDRLKGKIKENNGEIILNREIKDLTALKRDFNKIIVTTPVQKFFKTKVPPMLGALNLILVIKEKFLSDGTYWLSVSDSSFPFVAVVEQTNLVEKKYYGNQHLIYVGCYYPQYHRYFKMTKEEILKEFLPFLQKINPQFNQSMVIDSYLSFNLFAQPVVPVNYSRIIPPVKISAAIYLANMQQVYPYDRGINYAIELGEKIAKIVINEQ